MCIDRSRKRSKRSSSKADKICDYGGNVRNKVIYLRLTSNKKRIYKEWINWLERKTNEDIPT